MARALLVLLLGVFSLLAQDAALDPAQQDKLLQKIHDYADGYVASLPNFLCTQTTRELKAGAKSEHWRNADVLVSSLRFNGEGEHRTLEKVNGKAVKDGKARSRPVLTTEGEFGILLSQVLGQESQAYFVWNRWEMVRGKRLAVFDFTVDKAHSTLNLVSFIRAAVPYSGSIFADPETGAVWRIGDVATDIPPALGIRRIATMIDYEEMRIGDRAYLLPVAAVVTALTDSEQIRHVIEFTDYRKFQADSVITFEPSKP